MKIHVHHEGDKLGPLTVDEVRALLAEGTPLEDDSDRSPRRTAIDWSVVAVQTAQAQQKKAENR